MKAQQNFIGIAARGLLVLCTVIFFHTRLAAQASGQDAQSLRLMDSIYHLHNQPMILINYVSTDCINCRASTGAMLREISKSVDCSHIQILIDDKNSIIELNRFPEIFGRYHVTFNERLSHSLSTDGRSGLFVVGSDIARYSTKTVTDSIVKSITGSYNSFTDKSRLHIVSKHGERTYKDTIFEKYGSAFEGCDKGMILYSPKFQVGRLVDFGTGKSDYFEFAANTACLQTLGSVINKYHPRNYLSIDSSLKILRTAGLPSVNVDAIRFKNHNCYTLFKYRTVSNDGKLANGTDNISVRTTYFLAEMDLDAHDMSDLTQLSKYDAFFFMDTFRNEVTAYEPDMAYSFDVDGQKIYFRTLLYAGGVAPTTVDFAAGILTGDKMKFDRMYSIDNAYAHDEISIHTNETNRPVLNRNRLAFIDLANSSQVPVDLKGMNISYVYDWALTGNQLNFMGISGKKTYYYTLNTNDGTYRQVLVNDKDYAYSAMKMDGSAIVGYAKDPQTNTLKTTLLKVDELLQLPDQQQPQVNKP